MTIVTLEEDLGTWLKAQAGLTALISTRVYLGIIPQGATMPCLTYQRISTARYPTHDSSGVGSELASPRFQFDAWGASQSVVKPITDALRTLLHGKRGSIGTITLLGALVQDEAPSFEPDTKLYRSTSDYILWQVD